MSRTIGSRNPTFDHPCGACGLVTVHSARVTSVCPECKSKSSRAAGKRWYDRNQRRKCDSLKEWRKDNPGKVAGQKARSAAKKPWRRATAAKIADNPNFHREIHYKKDYGITLAQFQTMLERQDGKCHLCGKDVTLKQKDAHMDHCHTTGKLRAILCRACNTGIGMLGDSAALLRKAAEYLDEYDGHA